jgi:hypothetical protein
MLKIRDGRKGLRISVFIRAVDVILGESRPALSPTARQYVSDGVDFPVLFGPISTVVGPRSISRFLSERKFRILTFEICITALAHLTCWPSSDQIGLRRWHLSGLLVTRPNLLPPCVPGISARSWR